MAPSAAELDIVAGEEELVIVGHWLIVVVVIVSQLCSDVIMLLVLIGLQVEQLQVYVVVVVGLRSLVISTYKSALTIPHVPVVRTGSQSENNCLQGIIHIAVDRD